MDVYAVLVNKGLEYEIDQLIAGSPEDWPKFRMGKGWDGITPPTKTITALVTEIAVDQTDIVFTKLSQTSYKVVCSLPLAAGFEDTVNEIGIFNDAGDLQIYGVFTDQSKTNSNEMTFSFTIELG